MIKSDQLIANIAAILKAGINLSFCLFKKFGSTSQKKMLK